MLYRIRYTCGGGKGEEETAIEANSPIEAIVKFRHLRDARLASSGRVEYVMSVSPEPSTFEESW